MERKLKPECLGTFSHFLCSFVIIVFFVVPVLAIVGDVIGVGVWLISSPFSFLQTLKKSIIYILYLFVLRKFHLDLDHVFCF